MQRLPVWNEVAALAPVEWSELVAERLAAHFDSGVAFGVPSLGSAPTADGFELVRVFAVGEHEALELERRARAELRSLARESAVAELGELPLSVRRLPPEDFARSWEKHWRPFRVGRLAVVRVGSAQVLRSHDVRLELEPGGAFGTGRHPTTRRSLRALERRVARGERVLDVGTGNGILAVASILFGAERALAFDLDPHAIPYAVALAESNRVAERIEFRAGGFEVLGESDRAFDGVLANIYADVIQAEAARLAERLSPGGWFVFSGCHRDRRAATERAIESAGLAAEERASTGRWDTYSGRRTR